jgi:hypothetical protein
VTHRTAVLLATAIMVVPLVGYPLVVGADGAPFPSFDDCVRLASPGDEGELDLVFGRRDSSAEAEELLVRVRGVGYVDAVAVRDGCGRWEVLYDGIEAYEQGLESRAEARGAGLEAELELEPPG